MKKLFLLGCLACATSLYAQQDVTKELIYDPDFEQSGRSQWKTNSFGRQTNNSFPLKHGEAYREIWSGGTVGDAYIYQDSYTTAPVGTYTLTVTAQAILQSNESKVCTGAWIYINDRKVDINKPGDYGVAAVITDGKLRVGAETKSCDANYVCIDNFRITYKVVYEDIKDYINNLIAEAEQLDQHNGTPEREELVAALNALKQLIQSGQTSNLDAAVKRLQDAMKAYRFSLASATNPMNLTEVVLNPSFELGDAGWKVNNFGTQTNNDFPGKVGNTYMEKWTDRGYGVSDGSLKQTITSLPNGKYKVTANAQNIQQNNPTTHQTGTYLVGETQRTAVNVNGVYTAEFTTVSGQITIGFINEGSTGNYVCVDNFQLYYLGHDANAETAAFYDLIHHAETLLAKEMNTADKSALQTAVDNARAITGDEGRAEAAIALSNAIEGCQTSMGYYISLNECIARGEEQLQKGKPQGQDRINDAINAIRYMKNTGNVDADDVIEAGKMIDNAIFANNVLNGTGTAPKVETGEVIVGSRAMVGRQTSTGTGVMERGFCWAENPNPTVLDYHSSNSQTNDETNWAPVYVMYDVEPSTELWVRAYAMTSTYAVGYGEPVRVITLPKGETEYTFLWNGDDEHNEWLDNAMREATAYYNTWTAIKGFHPTANYSPGTETADCSYGGWINVGPWRCNTGTMVHEMMHGTGVGQHGRWWSQELHPNDERGPWWLGERANRVTHFFENYDTSRGNYNCNGDGIHVCYEGNGNDMQQIRSCLLAQALYEDGLPAVSDGCCPFYSYESIDTLAYYITNNEYNTNVRYLCENASGKLNYKAVDSTAELLADSAYAWRILYDKLTGLYNIQNVKTGKYFSHNGSALNLVANKPSGSQQMHLMPSRIFAELSMGGKSVKAKPYWFARASRAEYPEVLSIESKTATNVSTPTLNFGNDATKQFWLIWSADDLKEVVAQEKAINRDRLQCLIDGSKTVQQSKHAETVEGQDATFLAIVNEIEHAKDSYTIEEVEAAVGRLFTNLNEYLPAIYVNDSIDVSFVFDDAVLKTGTNWTGLPDIANQQIYLENAPVFTASHSTPEKMPKGQYGLKVRGFQRPGAISSAMKNYTNGQNDVSVSITLGVRAQRIHHIGDAGRDSRLGKGGSEVKYSGYYIPVNSQAYAAYMDEGLYDNILKSKSTVSKVMSIGIKNASTIASDLLVADKFQLFYYGNDEVTDPTGIISTSEQQNDEVESYYNLSGVRVSQPQRGVTIVKFKDGHSVKVFR